MYWHSISFYLPSYIPTFYINNTYYIILLFREIASPLAHVKIVIRRLTVRL